MRLSAETSPYIWTKIWYGSYGIPLPEWKQTGGGYLMYKGHPFQIREDKSGDNYVIWGGKKTFEDHSSPSCFILLINQKSKTAILQSVKRGHDCFMDGTDDSVGLVHIAVYLAKKKNVSTLQLTDNSVIYCPDRVILSDLSFLTTGATWYERILPGLQLVEPENTLYYMAAKRRLETVSWSELKLFIPPVSYDSISAEANELARDVLVRLKKTGEFCKFFSTNTQHICRGFGLPGSLYGWSWFVVLSTVPETEIVISHRRRSTQKRRTAISVVKE